MKVIIADTSCLVLYDKINQLEILRKTFPELIVTQEVAEEFGDLPDWLTIMDVKDKEKYLELIGNLGKGEASSIALALEFEDSLLIIDEKKGRKVAEGLRIEIIGSLGVLVKAKENGVIQSVKDIFLVIDKTNFRITESLRIEVLRASGEMP
ncbi:MAG: DUF3368 domain-containing protein [Bacteroidia bacterium]